MIVIKFLVWVFLHLWSAVFIVMIVLSVLHLVGIEIEWPHKINPHRESEEDHKAANSK